MQIDLADTTTYGNRAKMLRQSGDNLDIPQLHVNGKVRVAGTIFCCLILVILTYCTRCSIWAVSTQSRSWRILESWTMPLLAALENVRGRLAQEAREFWPRLQSEAGWQFARLLEHALDQALAGERARCAHLADICREAAWEKLHTGNWKDVSLVWRDAYGLSVVLYTLACLPAEQSADHLPALDLAVIMGSPRFRELVDELIDACQVC